jgi:hypothetical protein
MPPDFMLRYRGTLSSNGDASQKAKIRRQLSPQLLQLCHTDSRFNAAMQDTVNHGTMNGGAFVPGPMTENLFCLVPMAGFRFVAIVNRIHSLIAELDITFLRRGSRGNVIRHGGDLDNRLKTLFDALRMPHTEAEVADSPSNPEEKIFCLLEDDALITNEALPQTVEHVVVCAESPGWSEAGPR